ncbi:MAG: site-specific integrase [Clostridia bacterium]|nr:site-specific integrase [Clostridia bacterium]
MPKKSKYQRKSTRGSITHASGRGEKCWKAAITEDGKKKHLGWFASEQEADEAILAYIDNPGNFPCNKTFKQVYNEWYNKYLIKEVKRHSRKEGRLVDSNELVKNSTFSNHKAAFNAFECLHKKKFIEITKKMVEEEIYKKNPPMQRKLKVLIRFLAEYALDEEIIDGSRFYELQNVKTESLEKSEKHYPFSQAELDALWANSGDRYIQVILMGIYSGVRPGELMKLKKTDVQLEKNCFWIHKGKNYNARRAVPIHKRTKKFFDEWMNLNDSDYLITRIDGSPMKLENDYNGYLDSYWDKKLDKLGILHYIRENGDESIHRPHDMRVTFSTRWADQGLNEVYRQKIQGHSSGSVGIDVYTQPFIESLVIELNKLK